MEYIFFTFLICVLIAVGGYWIKLFIDLIGDD